jgi:glycosyltransferase involved in cell wall biosynthesis
MTISVVMPVYNASHYLRLALPPLVEMAARGEVLEVIVVDDGSTDDSAAVAAGLGARVIPAPCRGGPGAARNLAAGQAKGEILWLVDADVIAHTDGAEKIRAAFEDPSVVAVFGSYDDTPPAENFASQYKNLVHHYYHQKGQREASTFWAGCGALRKREFLEVGGFDVERYTRPSIEDIELGYRLRALGKRILLLHDLKGTHLKVWTVRDVIFTDVFRRAIPWARLMLNEVGLTDDLNVSTAERLRAALAGVFVLGIAAAVAEPSVWWLPLAILAGAIGFNWDFFQFLRRRKGVGFALLGILFHQLYYLYGTAAFAWCWIESRVGRARRPAAAG